MKISKIQKQTYEKSLISMDKKNKNTFNALKNQYISKINSTLFQKNAEYKLAEENLESFIHPTEFKFDMYEKLKDTLQITKSDSSTEELENDLKVFDEKLSIFYAKDGLITRNNTCRLLKNGLNPNKVKEYKSNIFYIPFLYLCYKYQETLQEFSNKIQEKYPHEDKNLTVVQNTFNSILKLVSSNQNIEQTLYDLNQLIKMKINLDTIISVVFDENLKMDEQKINKHINNLSIMHNNFLTDIKKENTILDSENTNELHETIFKYLSMYSYYLLKDIYKSIQYDYYLLQKEKEDISWDMVKGKIASINFILDKLETIKEDFSYYHRMILYLKKNRLLNNILNQDNPFYTYQHINQCLFKIVTIEVNRWLLSTPEISNHVHIDLNSMTKLEMKKLEGMINSNLNIIQQQSIILPF